MAMAATGAGSLAWAPLSGHGPGRPSQVSSPPREPARSSPKLSRRQETRAAGRAIHTCPCPRCCAPAWSRAAAALPLDWTARCRVRRAFSRRQSGRAGVAAAAAAADVVPESCSKIYASRASCQLPDSSSRHSPPPPLGLPAPTASPSPVCAFTGTALPTPFPPLRPSPPRSCP